MMSIFKWLYIVLICDVTSNLLFIVLKFYFQTAVYLIGQQKLKKKFKYCTC